MMLLSTIDFEGLGRLISNYGFPIVVCIAFGWYIWQRTKVYDQKIDAVRNEYKELVAKTVAEYKTQIDKIAQERKEDNIKFVTALDNNTEALERMADQLEKKGVE